MRKELLLAAGLALATVGSASCKRQETPPPPPTPIAASGKPKPQIIEEKQRVQEKSIYASESSRTSFRVEYSPSDWAISQYLEHGLASVERHPQRPEAAAATISFRLLGVGGPDSNPNINNYISQQNMLTQLEKVDPNFKQERRRVDQYEAVVLSHHGRRPEAQSVSFTKSALFIDADKRIWAISLEINEPTPELEAKFEPLFEEVLDTFKATPQATKPAEAQKPPSVEKVAIRLKPEELSRALLTTPLENKELPAGFTSKGKSAGTLDATAQALGAIRQVNVLVVEADPRFLGMPSGGISYTVFPNASSAKDAYDMFAKRPNSHTINDSPYPIAFLVEQSPFAKVNIGIALVGNTFIAATLTSIDQAPREEKTVQLAQAGIKHLQRVGR